MSTIIEVETHRCFGGVQGVFKHPSIATGGEMTFAVFVPPAGDRGSYPVVTFLSGLTCTHANVVDKGGYQRLAAELGMIVVCPDTSPRGVDVPDDPSYDFGQGAGFYIDATMSPWSAAFRMETYVTRELPALIAANFPVDPARHGVFGHSMGGHGALSLALRHPDFYRSVSAFSPIVAPSQVPWGRKAFAGYLGADEAGWREHDAVALIEAGRPISDILVDVGTSDPFLERELRPELLEAACARANVALTLRLQEGYDHSYSFVSTFMDDHLRWHAERLSPTAP